jgi:hypothetical protein
MKTDFRSMTLALVLAGFAVTRHSAVAAEPAVPTLTIDGRPLSSLAGRRTRSETGIRPTSVPPTGVRTQHISPPRELTVASYLSKQASLTLIAGSGPRPDGLEMQLTFGLRYEF